MTTAKTSEIIKNFYDYFNASDLEKLFSLIDDNFIHEINYVQSIGKDEFVAYITANKKNYNEHISDYTLMISDDSRHATTKFTVKGKYLHTDETLVPAHGQVYELQAVNMFEIDNDKIIKGSCWFNENEWHRQMSII
jgi:steroid delta-isomerase-like uncharacterized protein